MKTNKSIRVVLLAIGSPLAVLLGCLGVETSFRNLLGWFLIFVGIGYGAGSVIYLWIRGDRAGIVGEEVGERSFWLIIPAFVAAFFGPPLEYLYLPTVLPRSATMQAVGLTIIVAGLLLRVWTRLSLRQLYIGHVQVTEGHCLVQIGPYHYIRHPGYAGFVLMTLGLAVGYSSLVGLLSIALLLLPSLAYCMWVEERLLIEHFGDAYCQYVAQTKQLLPGIW
jgi:protein-S-isoprenylcysteine O-methyltransferase Ste14